MTGWAIGGLAAPSVRDATTTEMAKTMVAMPVRGGQGMILAKGFHGRLLPSYLLVQDDSLHGRIEEAT